MIQLRTFVNPADNCGAKKLMVIHVYRGFKRTSGTLADTIAAVVDKADPNGIVKDSEIVKAVVVRVKRAYRRDDGTHISFDDNAVVIVDKDGNPRGTRVFGPIAREVKDAGFSKIASLATEVL